jgi:hypothetical protein
MNPQHQNCLSPKTLPEEGAGQAVYQLIYMSLAVDDFDQEMLHSILDQARPKNAELGITGLLLYSKKQIVQILEGPEDVVAKLFETIRKDKRHHHVTQLSFCEVPKRDFADWAMGFKRITAEDFNSEFPGFTDIVERKNINMDLLSGLSIRVGFVLKKFSQQNRLEDL